MTLFPFFFPFNFWVRDTKVRIATIFVGINPTAENFKLDVTSPRDKMGMAALPRTSIVWYVFSKARRSHGLRTGHEMILMSKSLDTLYQQHITIIQEPGLGDLVGQVFFEQRLQLAADCRLLVTPGVGLTDHVHYASLTTEIELVTPTVRVNHTRESYEAFLVPVFGLDSTSRSKMCIRGGCP